MCQVTAYCHAICIALATWLGSWCVCDREIFCFETEHEGSVVGPPVCVGLVKKLSEELIHEVLTALASWVTSCLGSKKADGQSWFLPLPCVQYILCWDAVEILLIWLYRESNRLLWGEMPLSTKLPFSGAANSRFPLSRGIELDMLMCPDLFKDLLQDNLFQLFQQLQKCS